MRINKSYLIRFLKGLSKDFRYSRLLIILLLAMCPSLLVTFLAIEDNRQEVYCTYMAYKTSSLIEERNNFVKKGFSYIPYNIERHKNIDEIYVEYPGHDISKANWKSAGDPCQFRWSPILRLFSGVTAIIFLFFLFIYFLFRLLSHLIYSLDEACSFKELSKGFRYPRLFILFLAMCPSLLLTYIFVEDNWKEECCIYMASKTSSPREERNNFVKKGFNYIPYNIERHKNIDEIYVEYPGHDISKANWRVEGKPCELRWFPILSFFSGATTIIFLFFLFVYFLFRLFLHLIYSLDETCFFKKRSTNFRCSEFLIILFSAMWPSLLTTYLLIENNGQEGFCSYVAYEASSPIEEKSNFVKEAFNYIPYNIERHKNIDEIYVEYPGHDISKANWRVSGKPCELLIYKTLGAMMIFILVFSLPPLLLYPVFKLMMVLCKFIFKSLAR